MPELIKSPPKNYLLTTLVGSFWNIVQFVATFIVGTVVSILLTRYFGAHTYGLLAYVIWFSTVVQLILNFGILATIQTWVPKYYFTGDLPRAAFIARQLLKIQVSIVAVGLIILLPVIFIWHRFVSFSPTEFTRLMLINLLPIISTMLITFFSTLLVALQRFKQSALIFMSSQVMTLLIVVIVVRAGYDIFRLLFLLGSLNIIILACFIYVSRDILWQMVSEWQGESGLKKMITFSSWAYINTILTMVVWDKSAFFFLGKFQSGTTIAIYGIAYSLALTVTSLLDPIVNVLITMLAELTAKKDWDRIKIVIRLCAKYVSLLLLPLVTLAYVLSPYIVRFVYGSEFLMVAAIFPWLLLSSIIGRTFASAWSIAQYMHDLHRIVPRNIAVACLNILLGATLIPRFGLWGAVIATVSTQLVALLYFAFFIRRYNLYLFNREYISIICLNVLLFSILYIVINHQAPFYQTLAISLMGVLVYVLFVMYRIIKPEDRLLFRNSMALLRHRNAT